MASALKTDVVIVGAGPTGLSLASQLLRYGVDFILIEKNPQTTELSKAIVVQARSLEIFREIGLADEAIRRGSTTMAFNMYHKGKKRAHLNLNGLGKGMSAFPFVLSLEQSKTEKLLAEHLLKNGKTIHWNSEFLDFTQTDSGVTVNFKNPNGETQTVEAAYLAGCDGASSPVRHAAGMGFKGDTIPKIFYVADAVLKNQSLPADEMSIFLIDNGFVLFFPMEGERHFRLIGILPDVTEEEAANLTFSDIEEPIKQKIRIPMDFETVNWFSHYKVHSRMAETFRSGRCFILGDAAHIHTPAGGQGMNTGIQDAYNLAWKIAFALKKPNDELLETYNTERMQNARRLLRTTDTMFDFMAGKHWYSDVFRLWIFPFFAGLISKSALLNRMLFPLLSQTGIAYRDSLLTLPGKIGKVQSGDRMHYFEFADGTNIFDHLTEADFKIIHFGSDADFSRFEPFGIIQKSFAEIPSALFGNETGFYILLRPDNHISYIGRDLQIIETLLSIIIITQKHKS